MYVFFFLFACAYRVHACVLALQGVKISRDAMVKGKRKKKKEREKKQRVASVGYSEDITLQIT